MPHLEGNSLMGLTELAMFGAGSAGAALGFVAGLRVCGPRLQTTWTERHPVELAEDVRAKRLHLRQLTAHTQRLVSRELEALNTNRPQLAHAVPLALEGLGHRYAHLSAEALDALAEARTPAHRRALPVRIEDAELVEDDTHRTA